MIKHVQTAQEFDSLYNKGRVFVDFFATWCGPCKMLSPVIEAVDVSGKVKDTLILKVDVDFRFVIVFPVEHLNFRLPFLSLVIVLKVLPFVFSLPSPLDFFHSFFSLFSASNSIISRPVSVEFWSRRRV